MQLPLTAPEPQPARMRPALLSTTRSVTARSFGVSDAPRVSLCTLARRGVCWRGVSGLIRQWWDGGRECSATAVATAQWCRCTASQRSRHCCHYSAPFVCVNPADTTLPGLSSVCRCGDGDPHCERGGGGCRLAVVWSTPVAAPTVQQRAATPSMQENTDEDTAHTARSVT